MDKGRVFFQLDLGLVDLLTLAVLFGSSAVVWHFLVEVGASLFEFPEDEFGC